MNTEMKPGYLQRSSLCPISFLSPVTSPQSCLFNLCCTPGSCVFCMHKTVCGVLRNPVLTAQLTPMFHLTSPLQRHYLCLSSSRQKGVFTNLVKTLLSVIPLEIQLNTQQAQKLLVRGTSRQTDDKERLHKPHFLTKPDYSRIRRFNMMFCKDCNSLTLNNLLQSNIIHFTQ